MATWATGHRPRWRRRGQAPWQAEALEGRHLLSVAPVRFSRPIAVPFNSEPNSAALADFNRDGRLDLAVANGSRQLGVALGNGNGTFRPAQYFQAGLGFLSSTLSVTTGDFNNDGRPDLVASNFGVNSISVLLNTSTGNSLSFAPPLEHGAGAEPVFVAVGDFDRDGKLDVATANIAADPNNSVGILLGNGNGTFQDLRFVAAGANPNSLAVGDFNRDGIPDLAVTYSASAASNPSTDHVGILLGNGDGTFQTVRFFPVGKTPISVAVGDFDRDGILDLAVANPNSNNVSVLLGDGEGNFSTRATYRTGQKPLSVMAADLNGDGKLDLAVANSASNNVKILLGNGDGTFFPRNPRQNLFPAGSRPNGKMAVGPIARGYLPDLAVPNANGQVSVLLNRTRLRIRVAHR
ncbi:MAG: VCBS repeat-containing protein [Isosphaeraceae bacterium]|nr:VCBS repeat-containing protein [Isosphaeraceae bacterium]